jgi:membrane protein DedA with SNARE-associated domain
MNFIIQFLESHGYAVLFAAVFVHQMYLPIPAFLFLLAAGALASSGVLSLVAVLGCAIGACVLADVIWYEAGRLWGYKILHFIYGLALDPTAADQRSKKALSRYRPQVLLLSKFVGGMDAAAVPMAGLSGTSRPRFISFDAAGAFLWAGAYTGIGFVFSKSLDRAVAYENAMGKLLAVVTLAGFFLYVGGRLVRWHRSIRIARITPEEL